MNNRLLDRIVAVRHLNAVVLGVKWRATHVHTHLAAAVSNLPIVLLHADHDEESFALRHQVLADIATLPGASIYLWFEPGGQVTRRAESKASGD